jgi:beta-glucosidase-like glycosyl hydrolase
MGRRRWAGRDPTRTFRGTDLLRKMARRPGSPSQLNCVLIGIGRDVAKHNQLALEIARQGIVLLNEGALPLATDKPLKIAVIGGYAQQGVISGTGSGAVAPVGGFADVIKIGGAGIMGNLRNLFLFPPSPVEELRKAFPNAQIDFDPGYTPAEAALTARRADVVIALASESRAKDSIFPTCRCRGARMP